MKTWTGRLAFGAITARAACTGDFDGTADLPGTVLFGERAERYMLQYVLQPLLCFHT
jgi:hypothetical protein